MRSARIGDPCWHHVETPVLIIRHHRLQWRRSWLRAPAHFLHCRMADGDQLCAWRALPGSTLRVSIYPTSAAAVQPLVGARTATSEAAPVRGGGLEGEEVIEMVCMVDIGWGIGAERVDVEGATLGGSSAAGVEKAGDITSAKDAGTVGVAVHDEGERALEVEVAEEGGRARGAPLMEIEGADGAAVPPSAPPAVAAITLELFIDVG